MKEMLLLKKLCRVRGGNQQNSSSTNRSDVNDPNGCRQRNNLLQLSNTGANSIPANSSSSNNIEVDHQSINRVFCRTPPPVYDLNCALPETPPPSYSQSDNQDRQSNSNSNRYRCHIAFREEHHQQRQQSPEILQLVEHLNISGRSSAATNDACSGVRIQNDLQEERSLHPSAVLRNEPLLQIQNDHHQHQEEQEQRYRNQRRRQRQRQRLHWLQQQRRLININAASTDSSSSSSCDFDVLGRNQRGRTREQRQSAALLRQGSSRPGQLPRVFKDAYCPDLLYACSLILNQEDKEQRETSDSSIGSFTNTPPNYNTDYAEIDQLQNQRQNRSSFNACTASTPDLRSSTDHNLVADGGYLAYENGNVNSPSVFTINTNDSYESQRYASREMGQNFSLRRPRISLTWVLREQQQQQQQESQQNQTQTKQDLPSETKPLEDAKDCITLKITEQHNNQQHHHHHNNNNNGLTFTPVTPSTIPEISIESTKNETKSSTKKPESVQLFQTEKPKYSAPKKRYRLKHQLPGATEPLNGYATTPTGHVPASIAGIVGPQKFFSSQNLPDCKENARNPSKELYFVCTPQRLPRSYGKSDASEALAVARKRSELQRRLATKHAADSSTLNSGKKFATYDKSVTACHNMGEVVGSLEHEELKSLKCPSYSEPSLIAISEGNPRRHRHRKRRDRARGAAPKFGYEISNVDEFLSKCSLASPGNIPVVLSTSSTLYQTRPGGFQAELPLPLGMVVNAVFKNQNWLYVQTPHAEEGYVGYTCCLPLGILPPPPSSRGAKPTPCWESNGDVFPRPCGNMTDSEKEIRLRGGTRSDGARTPCGKRVAANGSAIALDSTKPINARDVDIVNGNIVSTKPTSDAQSRYGEQQVDRLYLRAASQPKLIEKAYAQLRSIKNTSVSMKSTTTTTTMTDEYITLQAQQQAATSMIAVKHSTNTELYEKPLKLHYDRRPPYATNGQNGQHFHPNTFSQNAAVPAVAVAISSNAHINPKALQKQIPRKNQQNPQPHSFRETLVAITMDYNTESINLKKGEIVTLCECRETKDQRQWFYVKSRDGREGYIPAEVAGHGFL